MARRAWLINAVNERFPTVPHLILDSGNFTDNPSPEGEVKTHALVEGMSRLGYDVVNVGDRELNKGWDAYLKRTEKADFPLISSNIVRQDSQQPVFKPWVIVDAVSPDGKNSMKIGVVGATRYNPLFLKSGPDGSKIVIRKAQDVVPQYVKELAGKVDTIVLLAALHKEEAKRIVAAAPEIDFVVASYGGIVSARQEKIGETELLYSGNQGKRIGETRVMLDEKGAVTAAMTTMHMLSARYPHSDGMLRFVHKASLLAEQAKLSAPEGQPSR